MSKSVTIADLSFARRAADGVDLWAPTRRSGDYASDCELGRGRADELLDYMREHAAPGLLGHVAQAIARAGAFAGIEVGFFHQIALHAMQVAEGPTQRDESATRRPVLRLVRPAA